MFNSLEALWSIVTRFQIQRLFSLLITGHSEVFILVCITIVWTRSTRRSLAYTVACLCPRKNSDSHLTEPLSYSSSGYPQTWNLSSHLFKFPSRAANCTLTSTPQCQMTRTLMKRWESYPQLRTTVLRQCSYRQGRQGSESDTNIPACTRGYLAIIRTSARDKLKHGRLWQLDWVGELLTVSSWQWQDLTDKLLLICQFCLLFALHQLSPGL